ncbi:RNA methyltransferase, partial [Lactobacillus sp. XV13L]|nr:RNA methyltransferase [Lactobacillus sp. XV13L]
MQLPKDFIQKYQQLLIQDAPQFLASFSDPVTSGFRINPLKARADQINESLTDPINQIDNAYYGVVD